MPVFNEGTNLARTIDALATAIEGSGFEPELVLVDDGSKRKR
jgi:glycosyltransferase involved in cell wall biosynthesis